MTPQDQMILEVAEHFIATIKFRIPEDKWHTWLRYIDFTEDELKKALKHTINSAIGLSEDIKEIENENTR